MKLLKKVISFTLCVGMLLSLCACGNTGNSDQTGTPEESAGETVDPNAPLSDGKTLKLLAITSSFGLNTTQLLYDVAIAEGCTDVVVGRLYGSGCTLEKHVENLNTNAAYYQYTKISSGSWNTTESASLAYGLKDEDWDIIFIQQSAAKAGIAESYGDYIDQLMTYVQANKTNPNARFVWNMTWAYQGDSDQTVFTTNFKSDQKYMYETIVDVTQEKVVSRTDFDRIIPTGTVIQNARTSAFGDTLCKDTYHLNNYGGILAAYGLYAVLTGQELTEIHLDAVAACANGIAGAEKIYEPLSETQKAIIIESVNNAIKTPFEITPSAYTEG